LSAHDRVAFIRAALEREDVTTTAIGNGIAIPHARTPALQRCRIAVGIMPDGVEWGAADRKPIHLAILIAAREADHAEHLRVMAGLAVRLRRPGLAERIRTLVDPTEIVATLRS
jgi:PTS system fructose-specific IIC component